MGKKVAVYARVSTNHQNVENQLQILREVAQKNDYEVVCEYLDSGISGAKGGINDRSSMPLSRMRERTQS